MLLRVHLDFESRSKSRLLLRLDNGEQAALVVERGRLLRGGETVMLQDGRAVEIIAAEEPLLQAVSTDPSLIAKAAYHLGNRHVAVQLLEHGLRFLADHVLGEMVGGLGLAVTELLAPFEPEGGAYGHSHAHGSEVSAIEPKIHSYPRTPLVCTRLLQLASQALPIGGYSHSQGLETAIDSGLVHDEASTRDWLADVLRFSIGTYELPALHALSDAWRRCDTGDIRRLNDEFLATRESAELRAATVQMGFSLRLLVQVLPELGWLTATLDGIAEPSLPCVWSGLAAAWFISVDDAATAYAWSWAENQVLVALKTVPLGQSAGQRILLTICTAIAALRERSVEQATTIRSNFTPGLAILSAQHETQYSRLFRS